MLFDAGRRAADVDEPVAHTVQASAQRGKVVAGPRQFECLPVELAGAVIVAYGPQLSAVDQGPPFTRRVGRRARQAERRLVVIAGALEVAEGVVCAAARAVDPGRRCDAGAGRGLHRPCEVRNRSARRKEPLC